MACLKDKFNPFKRCRAHIFHVSFSFDHRVKYYDHNELAKKRTEYVDITRYYARYYNNPNNPTSNPINPGPFQYHEKKHLENMEGTWHLKNRRLSVFAIIDLTGIWRNQNRRDEAQNVLVPIFEWFTEGFDSPDLVEAKQLLEQLA